MRSRSGHARGWGLAFLGMLLSVPGILNAEVYMFECSFKSVGRGGWIMKQAAYAVDLKNGTVVASDPAILHAREGKALTASAHQIKPGVYKAKWELDLPAQGNRDITVGYELRLDTNQATATIRAFPPADNRPTGNARCSKKLIRR